MVALYGDKAFPSLETLTFHEMPNLCKWEGWLNDGNGFCRLKEL